MNQIAMVALVFSLLGLAVWALRRTRTSLVSFPFAKKNRESYLSALERLPLTPQHSLYAVRATGRLLIISVSPAGCSVLLDNPLEEALDQRGRLQKEHTT